MVKKIKMVHISKIFVIVLSIFLIMFIRYDCYSDKGSQVSLTVLSSDHNFFSGEIISPKLCLVNHALVQTGVEVKWQTFVVPALLESGTQVVKLLPGAEQAISIELNMPEVRHRVELIWKVQAFVNEQLQAAKTMRYSVFPMGIPEAIRNLLLYKKVGIFDPAGKTCKMFDIIGIKYYKLKTQLSIENFDGDLVIVGAYAVTGRTEPMLDSLNERAKKGLSVVYLEQDTIPNKFPISLKPSLLLPGLATHSKICAAAHPVLAELKDQDLINWRGDGVIAHWILPKPVRGNFRIILNSGGNVEVGPILLEAFSGSGRFIFCQMAIAQKFFSEPVSQLCLRNIIRYALSEPSIPKQPVLFCHPLSEAIGFLDDLGLVYVKNLSLLDRDALAIIYAGQDTIDFITKQKSQFIENFRRFITNGGCGLIIGVRPETVEFFQDIGLPKIAFSEVADERLQIVKAENPILWGITDEDLKELVKRVRGRKPILQYLLQIKEDGWIGKLTEPCAIAKFQIGRGKVIICQLEFHNNPDELSLSTFSQLLTNLGAAIGKIKQN